MLFKNDSLSESDLDTFKKKKIFGKFSYASVYLFKVSNVFGVIN